MEAPADINKLTPPGSDLYSLSLSGLDNSGKISGYAQSRTNHNLTAFVAIPGPPSEQLNTDAAPVPVILPPDLRRKLQFGR